MADGARRKGEDRRQSWLSEEDDILAWQVESRPFMAGRMSRLRVGDRVERLKLASSPIGIAPCRCRSGSMARRCLPPLVLHDRLVIAGGQHVDVGPRLRGGRPQRVLRSKNSTCCGAAESPLVTWTQCIRQFAAWPRPLSRHVAPPGAGGKPAIACRTASSLGPSDGEQVSGFGGGAEGGLQPQPPAIRPTNSATAASARKCMESSLRRRLNPAPQRVDGVVGRRVEAQPDTGRHRMQDVDDPLEQQGVLGDHPETAADHRQTK